MFEVDNYTNVFAIEAANAIGGKNITIIEMRNERSLEKKVTILS